MNDCLEDLGKFPTDRKLPGLAAALQPAAVRLQLAAHLPEMIDQGCELHIELLKHTPGKRCVIAYDFFAAGRCQRLIGKLYRHDRGRAIFTNMCQLWQVAQSVTPRFYLPRPLAYLAEWGMVLQEAAPGIRADCLLPHKTFAHTVAATARNLAALHCCALDLERRDTLTLHLQKYCHPGAEYLMADLPEERSRLAAILTQLREDRSVAAMRLCPVHGDLGLTQIFSTADHVTFIDFDGLCCSHAALDLCNFIIVLQTHLGDNSKTLITLFLEHYDRLRPLEEITGVRQYQALIYLRRAMIAWRQRHTPGWRATARQYLTAAEQALAAGTEGNRHPIQAFFPLFGGCA